MRSDPNWRASWGDDAADRPIDYSTIDEPFERDEHGMPITNVVEPRDSEMLDQYYALSRTLAYPNETYRVRIAMAAEALDALGGRDRQVAAMRNFSAWAGTETVHELEESYTQAFDLNPTCSLEIGWHLFGEEYDRGAFMAFLRELLAQYGIPEHVELPDHITHVLPLLAAMPPAESSRLAARAVLPAMTRMIDSLTKSSSPWVELMIGLREAVLLRASRDDIAEAEAVMAEDGARPWGEFVGKGDGPVTAAPVQQAPMEFMGGGFNLKPKRGEGGNRAFGRPAALDGVADPMPRSSLGPVADVIPKSPDQREG